jgi:dihydroorotate dehydrogenase subfamily 1
MEAPSRPRPGVAGRAIGDRVVAPFGRRRCEVSRNLVSGGYRIFSALDPDGPEPSAGQFYMLAADSGWGGAQGRPYLARAFSVADGERTNDGVRLDFLVQAVGPGTSRLAALEAGEGLWIHGPLGRPFSAPDEVSEGAAGAILVGGGIGVAPLAIWRRQLLAAGIPARVLLGFRDRANSGGLELFDCSEVRLASEDGHAGHRGYVTDLLAVLLEGDDARRAPVYACGPPAMLEAVRRMCADRGVACELAMEAPMACGFGACFGCAIPLSSGDYMRLCVDGPVVRGDQIETAHETGGSSASPAEPPSHIGIGSLMEAMHIRRPQTPPPDQVPDIDASTDLCGIPLRHPVINGSGTFDPITARRAFGEELLREFPFSAFVSKTITPEPRVGNPPPRLWETPSGLINSIGLPNKGLDGFLEHDLPQLAELPVPLIVSVMGTSHDQFARLVEGVAGRDEVAALELNVSCPNVRSGLVVGESPQEAHSLLERLRPITQKPLLVKLTPNIADPVPVALAAEEGGADAVSLINTLRAAAIGPGSAEAWLGGGTGGLSGPAVRSIALAQIGAVASAVSLPVVAMGGISNGRDAAEVISAGAAIVAVGTESFRDPAVGSRIAKELGAELARISG